MIRRLISPKVGNACPHVFKETSTVHTLGKKGWVGFLKLSCANEESETRDVILFASPKSTTSWHRSNLCWIPEVKVVLNIVARTCSIGKIRSAKHIDGASLVVVLRVMSQLSENSEKHVPEVGLDLDGLHSRQRREAREARGRERHKALGNRRFSSEDEDYMKANNMTMSEIVTALRATKFNERRLLERLKAILASGDENPEDFFAHGGDQNLYALVNVISGGHDSSKSQLSAVQVVANLSPLSEKSGIKVARAAGPYLITLLSSAHKELREAAAVALGNLSLSGYKVVKVILNQDVLERLTQTLPSVDESADGTGNSLYAIYHLLHTMDKKNAVLDDKIIDELVTSCLHILYANKTKSPLELFWVLFALSCWPNYHHLATNEAAIHTLLEVCTYEIYQKSDPRPLVKVVTPIARFLANLTAGPCSETAILLLLRHPDTVPILMALLGTNYMHLCKETLWLFANVVNSESMTVQEEIVELDLMDKLEYHTMQAVQKIDPYAVH